MSILLLILLFSSPFIIENAFGQTIIVNETTPCFLNYTAGYDMWSNCKADEDYLTFALLPWEWITGGFFSMIAVGIIILGTYLKYHKAIYPLVIGILFLPIAWTFFPQTFYPMVFIMVGLAITITVWKIVIRQTKEY